MDERGQEDRELTTASHQSQDTALQAYVDLMSKLMIDGDLLGAPPGSAVRKVAQARTIEILLALDTDYKKRPLKLLHELGLINRHSPILHLTNAALDAADLREITLSDADLTEANLKEADLRTASLRSAVLHRANLQGGYLGGANLTDASLEYANLGEADLEEANLQGANLRGTNLQEADLQEANLQRANLREANLEGANLEGANLRRADLRGTSGLTQEQIEQSMGDEDTLLPDVLGRPREWANGVPPRENNRAEGAAFLKTNYRDPGQYKGPVAFASNTEAPSSFLDIGQIAVAYIGIPAVLLYPVGFLVLALQISKFYPLDFSTAWYAASLVPATVITGHGARLLLLPLLIALIISPLVALLWPKPEPGDGYMATLVKPFGSMITAPPNLQGENQSAARTVLSVLRALGTGLILLAALGLLVLFIALLLTVLLAWWTGIGDAFLSERAELLGLVLFILPAIVSGLVGGTLIAYDRQGDEEAQPAQRPKESSPAQQRPAVRLLPLPGALFVGGVEFLSKGVRLLSRGVRERWIFRGLLVAYIGSVLSALLPIFPMDALNQDPDLPHVEMSLSGQPGDVNAEVGGSGTDEGGFRVEDGLLLSHSDGYWHVIDTSRVDGSANTGRPSLLMTAGKKVVDVEVFESPLKKADLDLQITEMDEPAWVNKELTYTVTVKNHGPDRATKLKLTNDLPDFVSAPSKQADQRCDAEQNTVTCNVGDLDRNASTKVEVVVKPTSKDSKPVAIVSVDSNQVDPDASDDHKAKARLRIDASAPDTKANLSPEVPPGSWRKSTVTVDLSAEDNGGSGVKEIIHNPHGENLNVKESKNHNRVKFDITAQGSTEITYHAEDNVGNRAKSKSLVVRLDKTDPTTTIDSGPSGPTKDNTPTFAFSGSDEFPKRSELSFLYQGDDSDDWVKASGTRATLGAPAGLADGKYTFYVKAVDEAGNIGDPEEQDFTVDTAAPSASIDTRPEIPTNKSTVRFTFTSDDDGSTFECRMDDDTFSACNPPQDYDLADGEHAFQVRTVDKAGNIGDPEEQDFTVDTVEPVVNCGNADDAWHGQDVSIECTASDKGSGLSDNRFLLSTSVPEDSQTDNADTKRRKICDAADNCAAAGPIRGNKVDKKDPDIKIVAPDDGDEYKLEELINAKYTCSDGSGSGAESCKGPVAKGSVVDTDLGGPWTFEVKARDAAGNVATKSSTYVVAYTFGRFLSPLEARPTLNVTRAGDPVLVRFSLEGGQGKGIYAEGYPRSADIECDPQDPDNPLWKGNPQLTLEHQEYVWDTDETWSDSCRRLVFKLDDGSTHSLDFRFVE